MKLLKLLIQLWRLALASTLYLLIKENVLGFGVHI
jgi:hypothetical protein